MAFKHDQLLLYIDQFLTKNHLHYLPVKRMDRANKQGIDLQNILTSFYGILHSFRFNVFVSALYAYAKFIPLPSMIL